MDVQISVETTFDDGTKRTHQLGRVSRPYRLTQPEAFGLLLEDAKVILRQIQKAVLSDQVEEICALSRACPDCGSGRAVHDYRARVLILYSDGFDFERRVSASANAMLWRRKTADGHCPR